MVYINQNSEWFRSFGFKYESSLYFMEKEIVQLDTHRKCWHHMYKISLVLERIPEVRIALVGVDISSFPNNRTEDPSLGEWTPVWEGS